jgi:hypothetical protein
MLLQRFIVRKQCFVSGHLPSRKRQVRVLRRPDGHFKLPHLWPLKLPQAGRADYGFPDPLCVDRNAATPGGRLSGLQPLVGPVRGGGHRGVFDPLLQPAVEASEARQAVGIGRGAVGKPRTPKGPSTGLSCGRVACPRRARVARTGSGGVGAGRAFAAGPWPARPAAAQGLAAVLSAMRAAASLRR